MADEAGYAIAWLCRNGIDGASVVANHLRIASDVGASTIKLQSLVQPWTGGAPGLCALSAGASLSDLASSEHDKPVALQQVISATLLLPYFALVNQHLLSRANSPAETVSTTTVRCKQFNATLVATASASWLFDLVEYPDGSEHQCVDVIAEYASAANPSINNATRPVQHRTEISIKALEVLHRFAANTYAPATKSSRQGAGAGETDND